MIANFTGKQVNFAVPDDIADSQIILANYSDPAGLEGVISLRPFEVIAGSRRIER